MASFIFELINIYKASSFEVFSLIPAFVWKSCLILRITYCFSDFSKSSLTSWCANGFILFLYKITEFFNGEIWVYLTVLRVIPGKHVAFFLGLILDSIKILSLLTLCTNILFLVYYRTLNVFKDFVLLGGYSIFLRTMFDIGYFYCDYWLDINFF